MAFFTHLWRILNNESGQLTNTLLNLETESRRLFESPFQRGPTEQELAGIETLRLQADPTRRLAAARTRFEDVEGPGIDAALVAAGLGRSGAIGEARAQGIAALTLPIEQQVAQAQNVLGQQQLQLGGNLQGRGFAELERRRAILGQLQQLRIAQANLNARGGRRDIRAVTSAGRSIFPGGVPSSGAAFRTARAQEQGGSRAANALQVSPVGALPPSPRAPTATPFADIRGAQGQIRRAPTGQLTITNQQPVGPLGPGGSGEQPVPGTLGFGGINPTIDPFSPGFLLNPNEILGRGTGFAGFNPDPRRVTRRPLPGIGFLQPTPIF